MSPGPKCCKTHAAGRQGAWLPGLCRAWAALCHSRWHWRDRLAQGLRQALGLTPGGAGHGRLPAGLLVALGMVSVSGWAVAAPGACAGPALTITPWADGLWWLPAQAGEADVTNRGQVLNLVLLRSADGRSLWALGSGPSPAFGRALACQVRQQLGLPLRQVISPWARPELVLGVAGLGPVQHWGHATVAASMARQCPTCVARLRERLGTAAADLAGQPVRLPTRLLQGPAGMLGPWRWWALPQAAGRVLTLWRLGGRPLWVAPGLLPGNPAEAASAPPDGREADLRLLLAAARQAQALAAPDGEAAQWLGDQGSPAAAGVMAEVVAYWAALLDAAREAINQGVAETDPPPPLPGVRPAWQQHPRHALNWQRAWRQLEPELLGAPAGR